MFHASEEDEDYLGLSKELSASALSIGPGVDIMDARRALGDGVCILGNLDPVEVLLKGSAAQVAAETTRIVSAVGGPGYMFNTGECVPRETPVENVEAMMQAARTAWASV